MKDKKPQKLTLGDVPACCQWLTCDRINRSFLRTYTAAISSLIMVSNLNTRSPHLYPRRNSASHPMALHWGTDRIFRETCRRKLIPDDVKRTFFSAKSLGQSYLFLCHIQYPKTIRAFTDGTVGQADNRPLFNRPWMGGCGNIRQTVCRLSLEDRKRPLAYMVF
jgi:hypothetical protein